MFDKFMNKIIGKHLSNVSLRSTGFTAEMITRNCIVTYVILTLMIIQAWHLK